jgi:alpha-1,6-mannosyltransferase
VSFVAKYKIIPFSLSFLSFLLYFWFFYFQQRSEFLSLFLVYAVLFAMFLRLIEHFKNNIKTLALIALIFRLLCLVSLPNLSQDFYRFIWDGRLIANGFNPYLFTPQSFIASFPDLISQSNRLIEGMGQLSADNFSNYPPIHQFIFFVSAWLSPNSILGSVVVMRLIIMLADIGIFYVGVKLLEHLKLPVHSIFLYLLNPFIIIELTGNLHFEGVMLFFLIVGIYLLIRQKWMGAALAIGASISVKLIPLLMLPVFIRWFIKVKPHRVNIFKLIAFYSLIISVVIVSFLPFLNADLVVNYSKTIGLWFQSFEFNASIYYLARALGYYTSGYNQIAIIGKIIAIIVLIAVFSLSVFRKNYNYKTLLTTLLFAFSIYFFTATTVHPWYIATLLILGVFTGFKFPLLWSFTIILSYLAYATSEVQESYLILMLEYLPVYVLFFWEIYKNSFKHAQNIKTTHN